MSYHPMYFTKLIKLVSINLGFLYLDSYQFIMVKQYILSRPRKPSQRLSESQQAAITQPSKKTTKRAPRASSKAALRRGRRRAR